MKFLAREVCQGGCTQFSYEGEKQQTIDAESKEDLLMQLGIGPNYTSDTIDSGPWGGGVVVKTDTKWVRIKRIK